MMNSSEIDVNDTVYQFRDADFFKTPDYQKILILMLNAVVFSFGIIGNVIVTIVLSKNRVLFEPTGTFLFGLAVADLIILLIAQPVAVMEFCTQEVWLLGPVLCKIEPFIENTASNASVLTILAISLERYMAICHPLHAQYMCTETRAVKISLLIWLAASVIALPLPVYSVYKFSGFYDGSRVPVCVVKLTAMGQRVYIISMVLTFYVVPSLAFIYLYSAIIRQLSFDDMRMSLDEKRRRHHILKTRQQLVYMLVAIILAFVVCVLPFRVVSLWFIYTPKETVLNLGTEAYNYVRWIPRLLLYVNSAINPLIYNMVSSKFRLALHRICRGRPTSAQSVRLLQSTSSKLVNSRQ